MNKIFYLLSAVLLLVPVAAVAADLNVTCETKIGGGGVTCDSAPLNGALFDEDNLLPGDTVIRSLRVTNNHDEPCDFALDTKNEVEGAFSLADRLWTVIRDTAGDKFGVSDGSGAASNKTMSNAFGAGPIGLGTLAKDGSVTDYEWAVTFDEATGNDWQNETAMFDFDMTFTCDEGVVGGTGDEGDCCLGPDEPGGGQILGVVSGEEPPGGGISGLLDRFPTAGAESAAKWLEGEGKSWSRLVAAALAMMLTVYLMVRVGRLAGRHQAAKHK